MALGGCGVDSSFLNVTINDILHKVHWLLCMTESVVVELLPGVLSNGKVFNNWIELSFVASAWGDESHAHCLPHGPFGIFFTFAAAVDDIGPMRYMGAFRSAPVEAAILIRPSSAHGQVLVLTLKRFPELCKRAPDAQELLFADHVRTVVENEHCLGSMNMSFLQSCVSQLPHYAGTMKEHKNNFGKFLRFYSTAYSTYWNLYLYSEDETTHFQLPMEFHQVMRVMSTKIPLEMSMENDCSREHLVRRAEGELSFRMLQKESRRSLAQTAAYFTMLPPRFVDLIRHLAQDPNLIVLLHRHHPILIEQRLAGGTSDFPDYFLLGIIDVVGGDATHNP
jgi:hypothetical protein